jgi:hypothetical protein
MASVVKSKRTKSQKYKYVLIDYKESVNPLFNNPSGHLKKKIAGII